jgi:hypothetical protein
LVGIFGLGMGEIYVLNGEEEVEKEGIKYWLL